ncbi:transglycosylase SLT domain-containing protein [Sphingobium sp. CAP-1]|nr:transglycosylase SLT domain-containing protein [Sphingobium sp. CAP-1]
MFTHGIVPIEGGTGKNGQFLTSPKGAIGPAQVMPGTAPEAAKLAGLSWDEQKYRTDHGYNLALGEAYYAKQLATFGDPLMAAAAYNAGPGSAEKGTGLRGAIAKAKARGGSWRDYLPAETKDYVEKFAQRIGATAGNLPHDRVDEADIYSRINALAENEDWSPERKRAAEEEADRYVGRQRSLQQARESDAYDAAVSSAVRLGDDFTDVAQLGTSFASMSPQQQLTLTNMADANRNAKIKAATPKDGNETQSKLELARALNPAEFARTDLRPFANQITPSAMTNLVEWQKQYQSKGGDFAESITSGISRYSKIDGLKLSDGDYAKVFTDMDKYVRSITDGGREKVTDDIVRQAWQRATLKVATPGMIWGERSQRRYEVQPGTAFRVSDIPPGTRATIVSAWQKTHGGQEPNDAQIAQIYIDRFGRFQ